MGFMQPVAQHLSASEAKEYLGEQDTYGDGRPIIEEPEAGWYGRLSAPGYMDCTDWTGPFSSEQEALDEVMDLYEVDENGDDLTDDEEA